jgi:hypothetical protein
MNTGRVRKMNVAYNPFITLVEPVSNYETVLSKKHHKWSSCKTVVLPEKPLWIQLIHDENITNREKIHYLETNKISFEDFAIKPKFELKSDVKIFISNGLSFLKRIWYKIK